MLEGKSGAGVDGGLSSLELRVRGLEDRQEILNLVHRFQHAQDSSDWAAMTEIITEESFVDSSRFGIQKGVDAVIAVCKRALGHYDGMLHAISNVLIEVDGDSAVARYYGHSHAMRRGVEGGDTVTNIGEAMMEFVRTPQGWRVLQYKSRLKWHEGNPKVRVNQADPATHQVGS